VLTSSSTEPTAVDLGADVFLVEHLLDLPLCAHIIQVAECCQFAAAGIEVDRVAPDIRSNDLLYLDGKVAWIQQFLLQIYGVGFPHAETCSILRYNPSQYYKRHVDNLLLAGRLAEAAKGVPTRDVSIIGYLNQECEGGETYLDRQGIKVKPEAGAALVFPSYYTYPHQSLPVTAGVKYAFTTWLFH
jgi:prolyl 4-hydroxylase